MQTLTCPIPSNINPLQTNGFLFSINKLPSISFFCQEANVPSIDLPSADMSTPLVLAPLPGDKINFGDLNITFLIDGDMANYIAIHNWMIGLGFPESHEQYANFLASRTDSLNRNELIAGFSDGNLQILSSSNNALKTVHFIDLFPTSLQSLQMQSTTTETTYLAGNATFRYTYYKFE